MCEYRHGIEGKIKEVPTNYDLESLQYRRKSALDDLEKIAAGIKAYVAAIDEHIKTVEATTFKAYVYLERRINNGNQVIYEVDVRLLPQIPQILNVITGERGHLFLLAFLRGQGYGADKCSIPRYQDSKKFEGKERRAALAYADELAKKHGAEIIKAGWGWKENKAA
jgi:GNAT superfamily N-acetyltransferase